MSSLSIIIPAYNEEKRIGSSLNQLFKYLEQAKLEAEIIVVDDGSSDSTVQILERFKPRIEVLKVQPNMGKGYAIRAGVMRANGDLILFMDADMATPPEEIGKILPFGQYYDIVIGSRKMNKTIVKRNPLRALAGNVFHSFSNLIIPILVQDSQCGFKMFRQEVAKEIFSRARINRWSFDIEILFLAQKMNCSIKEVPIRWQEQGNSKIHLWRDAYIMTRDLLKIRYNNLVGMYDVALINEELGE